MKYLVKTLILTIFLVSLLPLQLVQAHSSLVRNSPQGGAQLTESPKTVELWFKDPVIVHSNSIKVTDTSGKSVPMADTSHHPADKTHVIGKLKENLPVGIYMVELSVVALDGDVINEKFTFEVINDEKDKVTEPFKLVKQTPSDGEIVDGHVEKIELWFNQPAELTAIGVFNERSFRLKEPYQDPANPNHLIVELDEPLEKGTYQVTWYGHPTSKELVVQTDRLDVFYFAVDEFAPLKENPLGTPIKTTPFLSNLGMKQVGYWFFFIGITLLFGASFFIRVIMREQHSIKRWTLVSWSLFILSLLGIILMLTEQRIVLSEISLKEFLSIKFIYMPIAQLIILLMGLLLRRMELVAFTLAILLIPLSMGHASYPRYGGYFTIVINALHILSAGIWIGGLFSLLIFSNKNEFSNWLQKVGVKFSRWAVPSLAMIIFTGLIMTYKYIPSFTFESFYKSNWGKAILFKIALTIFIVIFGYIQRRTIKNFTTSMIAKFKIRGLSEFLYGLLVLFFASTLVVTTPSAAEQGIYPIKVEDKKQIQINVTPFKPGLNVMNFDFKTEQKIGSVTVKISMPPQYKVEYDAFKVGPNQFAITGNVFHATGTLFMEVKAEMETGEEKIYQYTIVVPGESRFNE
jgi:copper transport protein